MDALSLSNQRDADFGIAPWLMVEVRETPRSTCDWLDRVLAKIATLGIRHPPRVLLPTLSVRQRAFENATMSDRMSRARSGFF